jgi:hypothetical protein
LLHMKSNARPLGWSELEIAEDARYPPMV